MVSSSEYKYVVVCDLYGVCGFVWWGVCLLLGRLWKFVGIVSKKFTRKMLLLVFHHSLLCCVMLHCVWLILMHSDGLSVTVQ